MSEKVFKSIRAKLFLTFLLTTIAVVSGMYLFIRWSLERGFDDFVDMRQQEQVASLVEVLDTYYADYQGWDRLQGNKQKWVKTLMRAGAFRHFHSAPWIEQAFKEPADTWPPQLTEAHIESQFTPLGLRVMLLRDDKTIIFGRNQALRQLALHPIHHQGQVVGYLGVLPGKPVNLPREIKFLQQQTQSFVWIALSMVLLSAILALLLAYTLGRPLRRITAAAKKLAVGQYDVRLPVESGDELGHLSRDFNDLAAALQHSEQTRRRWVADISHELRTPLSVLRAELEALQDGLRPMTRESVDSLFGDVMRLNRLTEDLYQLSLSDQGTLSYRKTPIDPVQLLQQDIAALAPEYESKQLKVSFTNRLTQVIKLYADPDRLSQLYLNLLNNSVNYTNSNGKLDITLSRDRDKLSIHFADSAPGVPEQEVDRLFERFYRVESSRNRHHGGAGLGLAICTNIVKAHNGTIRAQPSTLGGLDILVTFPIDSKNFS